MNNQNPFHYIGLIIGGGGTLIPTIFFLWYWFTERTDEMAKKARMKRNAMFNGRI